MNGDASSHGFTAIAVLMFIAGMAIPLMATLNAALGTHLQNPFAAGAILFGIAFVLAGAVLLAIGLPTRSSFADVPWYLYAGAALVVLYIFSITWSAPRIGVGNAVFFVLLGQLVAAAAIDHYGAFGAMRFALTGRRALGIAVMALGVWLAKKTR